MTTAIDNELFFLLMSFLFGALCGVFYDGFRFLRTLFGIPLSTESLRAEEATEKKAKGLFLQGLILAILDFLFMLLSGLAYALFVYAMHNGILRFYSLFALALGALLYLKTVSRLLRVPLLFIAKRMRSILKTVFSPIHRIIYAISRIFLHILRKIRCFLQKNMLNYNKRSKKRDNSKKKKENALPSETFRFGKMG